MDRAGRHFIGELRHGRDDPAPGRRPVIIAGGRKLIRAQSAFLKYTITVALEHKLRRPPNIDLGYQSALLMKSPPGPPMTLGNAANAKVRLIVWCKRCGRQVEPDPAEMAARYGENTPVLD